MYILHKAARILRAQKWLKPIAPKDLHSEKLEDVSPRLSKGAEELTHVVVLTLKDGKAAYSPYYSPYAAVKLDGQEGFYIMTDEDKGIKIGKKYWKFIPKNDVATINGPAIWTEPITWDEVEKYKKEVPKEKWDQVYLDYLEDEARGNEFRKGKLGKRALTKKADGKIAGELDEYIEKKDEKGLYSLLIRKDVPAAIKELAAHHLVLIYRDRSDRIKLKTMMKNINPKIVETAGLALASVLLKIKDIMGLESLAKHSNERIVAAANKALKMLRLWEQRKELQKK